MFYNTAEARRRKQERQAIVETWSPRLAKQLAKGRNQRRINEGSKAMEKLAIMSHVRSLMESAATLDNTVGRGSFNFGNNPASGNGYTGARGSGEVFDSQLFGVFIEAVANTIGFELLPVVPMTKSNGIIMIAEPVYAGGRLESAESKPVLFQVKPTKVSSPAALVVGTSYTVETADSGGENIVSLTFVGVSRLNGYYVFRLGTQYDNSGSAGTDWTAATIADQLDFDTNGSGIYTDASNYWKFDHTTVQYVNGFTDFVSGYAGAGINDTNAWYMNRNKGDRYNSAMARQVGERAAHRSMGINTWHRNFSAQTINVDIEYTTEQIQDLQADMGINALELGDTILQDQLTQHINEHILGDMFSLGWQHHYDMNQASGFNFNTYLDVSSNTGSAKAFVGADGVTALTIAGKAGALPASGAISENMSTLQRRIVSRIMYASSIINQRSRRGRGDGAVMNTKLVAALRDVRGFSAAPFDNDLNESGLYYAGSISGVKIYEDPLMDTEDHRVCVFRKGTEKDPGLKMCPYLLAEKISTIAEGTMAPKELLKSRYSIVPAGSNPQTSYLTFTVDQAAGYEVV